jgi:sugar O-acyltransferase (sialic acid O-acetyltransferase NeuD family)
MTTRRLYIIGAGGLAREMAQLAQQCGPPTGIKWGFEGFVGSADDSIGSDLGFGRVVGNDDWLLKSNIAADLVIGIGHPVARARVARLFSAQRTRFAFPNLVHPTALLDQSHVSVGTGNCITAGCIFTTDIEVGDFNLFNLSATVGHDARIGSFNVINPSVNLSGGVRLGDQILIGTGAQILENLSVGNAATVGAGAVVTRDVLDGQTVVGVPARSTTGR